MTRAKMDWRGQGGFFARDSEGKLVPTDHDGVLLPLDEDGYLLAPNPTSSPFGPLPPVASDVKDESPATVTAPVVEPTYPSRVGPVKKTVTAPVVPDAPVTN